MTEEDLFALTPAERPVLATEANKTLAARLLETDEARFEELLAHYRDIKMPRLQVFEESVRRHLRDINKRVEDEKRRRQAEARKQLDDDDDGSDDAKGAFVPDEFIVDKFGNILPKAANIRLALKLMGIRLSYNDFTALVYIEGFNGGGGEGNGYGGITAVGEEISTDLWVMLDDKFDFRPNRDLFGAVLAQTARQNRFHPVKDYLKTLRWDGTPRLKHWLRDYMGVEENDYTQAVGTLMLKSAVARVYDPGCAFDQMLLLMGEQGLGKSRAIMALCPNVEWFTDSMNVQESEQKIIEATRGKWLVEISDMRGSSKAEDGAVKAQLSRKSDRARMAYARLPQEVPRQFVYFGTANFAVLSDPTGNRRYWPVVCHAVAGLVGCDLAGLKAIRDQLWAEAVWEYELDPNIELPVHLWPLAVAAQTEATKENPFEERLNHLFLDMEGYIFASAVWELLGVNTQQQHGGSTLMMGRAMEALGWTKGKKRPSPKANAAVVYFKGEQGLNGRRIVAHKEYGSTGGAFPAYERSE